MRLLVDDLVATAQPRLTELTGALQLGTWVHTFDPFRAPADIAREFARLRPDVIVVDSMWLIVSSLLMALLRQSGCEHTRPVVGARNIDEVMKVKTAHHGFYDLVDLDEPASEIFVNLKRIHSGSSRLRDDRVWGVVSPPRPETDIAAAALNGTDLAILDLVCIGLPDKEIAKIVHMSVQSIRNRVSGMLHRSGIENRTQLAWMFANHVLVNEMNQSLRTRFDEVRR